MSSNLLTMLFAAALVLSLAVKLSLATRQMRHVAAHRHAEPPAFARTVSLESHQRAADYTLAKGRIGLLATDVTRTQRALISWFGIRGIGSIYYLMYAITHEVDAVLAGRLLSITVAVVVASIVVHGISVTPLMTRYEQRKTPRGTRRRDG